MKNKIFNFIKDTSGAFFIEAAFLMVALIPIFIGLSDYGLSVYEWKRLNNALQSQVLYIASTHGTSVESQAQQLNGATSFVTTSLASINLAGQNSSTGVRSDDISFSYGQWCGCSDGSSLNLKSKFADTPPYCPQPPDTTCNQSSYWGSYVIITATHQHQSLFNTVGMKSISFLSGLADILTPTLQSTAIVRIN